MFLGRFFWFNSAKFMKKRSYMFQLFAFVTNILDSFIRNLATCVTKTGLPATLHAIIWFHEFVKEIKFVRKSFILSAQSDG